MNRKYKCPSREPVDGDPDSQESRIVRVRSSSLSEISEDSVRRKVRSSVGERRFNSDL